MKHFDPWTLEDALTFFRALWVALEPVGYHVGLTGGVLLRGESKKDLDVLIYPRCTHDSPDIEAVKRTFTNFGMEPYFDRAFITERWRAAGSLDEKHVEGWTYAGKRVDIFFVR